jgi:MFS family permease
MSGTAAGIWLVVMRLFQGVGAAFLIANSTAILTDAFPENQRGMAVGINQIAAIAGSFIGLILGGLLGPIEWRLVFIISVPIGIFGSIWSYMKLKEVPTKRDTHVDWSGNLTFALGLVALMVGITYGIQPYGGHVMGWSSPFVLLCLAIGVITLFFFARIEMRSSDPMFRLSLFRIRAFSSGSIATLFSAIGRGGLMFTMVIWLQGIWLPLHGYNFSDTPLWAGIALLPLTGGFLVSGPICGYLSDKYGARVFTVGGMTGATLSFLLLQFLPADFSYPIFGALLFLNGLSMGMFAAPNRASIMNALPKEHRGVGSGMASTFQNSGQVLSIGIFFTLMIIGLSRTLPHALYVGLTAQGVSSAVAHQVSSLPPVSTLFASFLGYNPMAHLLGPHVLSTLSPSARTTILGRKFFPKMIEKAFVSGLHPALDFAAILCALAAVTSWMRGSHPLRTGELSALEVGVGAPANAD